MLYLRSFNRLILISLALIFSAASQAAPMYYTFTGTVTSYYDSAGIIDDTYGDSMGGFVFPTVEYVYLVDTAEDGTYTLNNGTTYTPSDNSSTDYNRDYFYTDFVSGSLIDEKDGGYFNDPNNVAEFNMGIDMDFHDGGTDYTYLYGGSDDDLVLVYNYGGLFADWIIGYSVTGHERVYDSSASGQISSIDSTLTLSSISSFAPNPVPIPAAIWMFGTTLIGLVGFGKRRKAA